MYNYYTYILLYRILNLYNNECWHFNMLASFFNLEVEADKGSN